MDSVLSKMPARYAYMTLASKDLREKGGGRVNHQRELKGTCRDVLVSLEQQTTTGECYRSP